MIRFRLDINLVLLRTIIYCGLFNCIMARMTAASVDVMLVYDTTGTSWVADNGGIAAFSADVVNRMNQSLDNSGIDERFRLVHSMSVNYTTDSLYRDLLNLQSGTGAFGSVHAARDAYAADLVALLIDTGSAYGTVGIGYVLTSWSGQPDYGYSVSAIRSVNISNTLTHEIGHNLGAAHAKYQRSSPGPNRYLDNAYSAGWYFSGSDRVNYHTIMAYNSDGYGTIYEPAPLFSTPDKNFQGTRAGDAQDGNNTRLLEQTMSTVAGYRTASATPDLSVFPPSADTQSPAVSQPITLSVQVTNQGDDSAVSTVLRFLRSDDSSITFSDFQEGSSEIAALGAGTNISETIELTAPEQTGTYYYGACVDTVPDEVYEANNCSASIAVSVITPGVPGDLDGSGSLELIDGIIALQIAAGVYPSQASDNAGDVDDDGRLGLAEAIYVLTSIAE